MKQLETTLLLLKKDNEILLAMKKRGFGVGKYNGIGGKLEANETPEMAMLREAKEEINVIPTLYEYVGAVEVESINLSEKRDCIFHLYIATKWEGIPSESEEMCPKWFLIDKIPYDKMFPDDEYWLPLVLEGKKINAFFEFDEDWNLKKKKIEELENSNVLKISL